jgi:hypothetical protein
VEGALCDHFGTESSKPSIISDHIKHPPLFIRLHWKRVTIILQQQRKCRKNWSLRRIKKNPSSPSGQVHQIEWRYQRGFRQRTNLFRFGGNFKSSSQKVILCRKELLITFITVFHISTVANNKNFKNIYIFGIISNMT